MSPSSALSVVDVGADRAAVYVLGGELLDAGEKCEIGASAEERVCRRCGRWQCGKQCCIEPE